MRARKLVLLAALLLAGGAIDAAHSLRDELSIGPTGCRVLGGRFYGPSFEFDSEARRTLEGAPSLIVENAFGAVVVSPGPAGEIAARLRTRVYAPDRESARRFAERVELRLEQDANGVRVTTNRDSVSRREAGRETGFETDLELSVPPETAVEVRSHHSRVELTGVASALVETSYEPLSVSQVAGDAKLSNRHGAVSAERVGGALELSASYGDVRLSELAGPARLVVRHGAVRAERVAGLRLEQRYGDLEAEQVDGDLVVQGVHAGVTAREVSGEAQVKTSYAALRLEGVRGAIRAEAHHSELWVATAGAAVSAELSDGAARLDAVTGPVELKVRRGEVRINGLRRGGRVEAEGNDVEVGDFAGPLSVEARLGDVRLRPAVSPAEALKAISRGGGSILLELPEGGSFQLAAEAHKGELKVELAGFELLEQQPGRVRGQVGSGETRVELRAERGDVTVRNSSRR